MEKKKYFIYIGVVLLILLLGCGIAYIMLNKKTIDNYTFKLDSKNKYEVITDMRYLTMLDDGGSNTNVYYEIDLDNKIISKIQEVFHANLMGTPSTDKKNIYTIKINNSIKKEIDNLLDEVKTKEDINDTNNYNFFTIKSLNFEKNIYNEKTIEKIKKLLKKVDDLN